MTEQEIRKKLQNLDIEEATNLKTIGSSQDPRAREIAREDNREIKVERQELLEKLKSIQVGRAISR